MKMPKMQDMEISKEEQKSMGVPYALGEAVSKYPCGLQISLGDAELEKLGLDDDCEVGEYIHLFAFAKVTSVSSHDTGDGEKCRVSLQITHLSAEDEDEENEEEDKEEPKKKKKSRGLYFER